MTVQCTPTTVRTKHQQSEYWILNTSIITLLIWQINMGVNFLLIREFLMMLTCTVKVIGLRREHQRISKST